MKDFLMWAWGAGAVIFVVATIMQRRAERRFEKAEKAFLRATATYERLAYEEHVRQIAAKQ